MPRVVNGAYLGAVHSEVAVCGNVDVRTGAIAGSFRVVMGSEFPYAFQASLGHKTKIDIMKRNLTT